MVRLQKVNLSQMIKIFDILRKAAEDLQPVRKQAKNLLIDDIWDPSKLGGAEVARTSDEATHKLSEGGWDTVYLDNDLGPGQKEGWEILNWIMRDLPGEKWPRAFVVFSSNSQARPRMESKLHAMGYAVSGKDTHGHPLWVK